MKQITKATNGFLSGPVFVDKAASSCRCTAASALVTAHRPIRSSSLESSLNISYVHRYGKVWGWHGHSVLTPFNLMGKLLMLEKTVMRSRQGSARCRGKEHGTRGLSTAWAGISIRKAVRQATAVLIHRMEDKVEASMAGPEHIRNTYRKCKGREGLSQEY